MAMKGKKDKRYETVATMHLDKNPGKWVNRLCIGTPTTGLVRMEWVNARFGQTIPTNWSHVDVQQWMSQWAPTEYQVADAENIIAKAVVENNFEWLLFIEHDNVLPPDAFIKINRYIIRGDIPVVAGVYFTKSVPSEPLVYRGKGRGFYADWKMGDKVWCSGVPFGFTLIHGDIIRKLWDESPEYVAGNIVTRRVFNTPSEGWTDPETQGWMNHAGTSDLQFCERLMKDGIFEKAGFPEYQKKEFPFLIDTSIFVRHIDQQGVQHPTDMPKEFLDGKVTLKEVMRQDI